MHKDIIFFESVYNDVIIVFQKVIIISYIADCIQVSNVFDCRYR